MTWRVTPIRTVAARGANWIWFRKTVQRRNGTCVIRLKARRARFMIIRVGCEKLGKNGIEATHENEVRAEAAVLVKKTD